MSPVTPTNVFEYAPAPESRSIVDIKPSYGLFINGEFVDDGARLGRGGVLEGHGDQSNVK